MTVFTPYKLLIAAFTAFILTACSRPTPAVVATPFALTAGITDLMKYEIDPSADALWDSVGTFVTHAGTENRQPRTPAQWSETRGHALILTEAANLLLMAGRHVASGAPMEDPAAPGDLTPAEAEVAIAKQRAVFVSFARGLQQVGAQMVQAADRQDAKALMELGGALDEVCENCHLQFWYPHPAGAAQ